jgi:hypothetical protein
MKEYEEGIAIFSLLFLKLAYLNEAKWVALNQNKIFITLYAKFKLCPL